MRVRLRQSSAVVRSTARLLGVILALVLTPAAAAQSGHVQIEVSTDFAQMMPGDSGILAITMTIEQDWHIYWPGISDSGMGITLDIDAPDSVTLDQPIWPTPKRYVQPGEILDHIYEGSVMVLVPFKLSSEAQLDEQIRFAINANYLVCKDVCMPGQASGSASLTIVQRQAQKTPAAQHDQIQKVYASRPVEFKPHAQHVRFQWASNGSAIMFRDATKIEFFPAVECTEIVNLITAGSTESNRLVIQFVTDDGSDAQKTIAGRLRSYEPTGIFDYDIHIAAPSTP